MAKFIGTINIIDAEIVESDAENLKAIVAELGPLDLGSRQGSDASAGRSVRLAFRPERVSLGTFGAGRPGFNAAARVEDISFRGDRSYLRLGIDGQAQPLIVVLTNLSADTGPSALAVGAMVDVHVDAADILVLPSQSSKSG